MTRKSIEEKIIDILRRLTVMSYDILSINNEDNYIFRVKLKSKNHLILMRINIEYKYMVIKDQFSEDIVVYSSYPSIYNYMIKDIVDYIEDHFINYDVLIDRRTKYHNKLRFNSNDTRKFNMEFKLKHK
jgi:hypothetical protein